MATKKKYQYIETPTEKPKFGSLPTKATYDTTKWDDTSKGQAALNEYNTAKNAVTGYNDFAFSQQGWLDNVLGKIKNYGDFSYDLNGDALYQQYKDKYIQQGKMAMADTMGQAAAMTGGYGNSYAQSVGQQVYQGELQKLNDIVPQLYQLALDRYTMGKEDLYNQYGLASTERQNEYGMYQDKYGHLVDAYGIANDAYYNGANLHQSEQSATNSAAGKAFDDAMALWGADTSQKWSEWEADESLRQYGNSEWWKQQQAAGAKAEGMISAGIMPDAATLEAWGVSEDMAQAMVEVVHEVKQAGIDERNRAEAHDIAMTLIANGVDVPREISAIAGLSPNAVKALQEVYQKASGGNFESDADTVPTDTSGIDQKIIDEMQNYTTQDGQADYLAAQIRAGKITDDQAIKLLDQYGIVPLTERNWEMTDDGGVNWLWGIDKDGKVRDQFGNEYTMKELLTELEKTMTTKEAKEYIKQLQEQLGI
ncbi:MAG: hypothetical protein UHG68_03415 [Clostridia bacterium]|nr:hypothetical protein [Clostridia bacterium]